MPMPGCISPMAWYSPGSVPSRKQPLRMLKLIKGAMWQPHALTMTHQLPRDDGESDQRPTYGWATHAALLINLALRQPA